MNQISATSSPAGMNIQFWDGRAGFGNSIARIYSPVRCRASLPGSRTSRSRSAGRSPSRRSSRRRREFARARFRPRPWATPPSWRCRRPRHSCPIFITSHSSLWELIGGLVELARRGREVLWSELIDDPVGAKKRKVPASRSPISHHVQAPGSSPSSRPRRAAMRSWRRRTRSPLPPVADTDDRICGSKMNTNGSSAVRSDVPRACSPAVGIVAGDCGRGKGGEAHRRRHVGHDAEVEDEEVHGDQGITEIAPAPSSTITGAISVATRM